MSDLLLSTAELEALCEYVQPAKQLVELHRQGFYRARRSPITGAVILERAHYEAVCAGAAKPANDPKARPRVRA